MSLTQRALNKMNWLTDFVRPRIRALVERNVPDNLWVKCPKCDQMIFHNELAPNLYVCPKCGEHMRMPIADRIANLFDTDTFEELKYDGYVSDPLNFEDTKKYTDRLKSTREKTKRQDSVVIGCGRMNGYRVVSLLFNFDFMGGSMGSGVGEAFMTAANYAVSHGYPFLVVPCSGGARMQEGIFSLMQMPKTVVAVSKIKEAKLPYIVLLTNPTTGGVSASFAMLGDIHIAEPGALIAFSGPRVIEGTIREKLPDDFQKSEFLLSHGMVDQVVHRKDTKDVIAKIIGLLTHKKH